MKGTKMSRFAKRASIVSTVALMAIGSVGIAAAQEQEQEQRNRDRGGDCVANMENCGPHEMRQQRSDDNVDRRRLRRDDDSARVNRDDDGRRVRGSRAEWRFDANRHERRRHRDDRFRFFFGGFWYPEPYWLGYGLAVSPRVSCGEGRAIVRARGFNRVRTIECRGPTFTYLGRRSGDAFRVILSSRTGRIIDVDRV